VDERITKREVIDLEVALTFRGKLCRALLYDLSMDGCMIDTGGSFPLQADKTIQFELPHAGATEGTVIWTKGQFGGAKFTQRLDQALVTRLGFRPRPQPVTKLRDQFGRPLKKLGQRFSV
jgi:PilZ domain-containing protein